MPVENVIYIFMCHGLKLTPMSPINMSYFVTSFMSLSRCAIDSLDMSPWCEVFVYLCYCFVYYGECHYIFVRTRVLAFCQ